MQNLIKQIKPENFADDVLSIQKPILLLCMPHDDDFPSQLKLLEYIALKFGTCLIVGLLVETFIDSFKEKLKIAGTPTFLIFIHGREKNRMLGLADMMTLESFITETIQRRNKE